MAGIQPTKDQISAVEMLRRTYGPESALMYEYISATDDGMGLSPQGLVRITWPDLHGLGNRQIFIRPDGTRVTWTSV